MTQDLVKFRVCTLAHSFLAFHNLISMPHLFSNTYLVMRAITMAWQEQVLFLYTILQLNFKTIQSIAWSLIEK